MYISHAKVLNFRALQSISTPLNKFSILLGENDVGKTSFLYALDIFFSDTKLKEPDDFFGKDTRVDVSVELTFSDVPDIEELRELKQSNGTIVISKVFSIGKSPVVKAIMNGGSQRSLEKVVLDRWFSINVFHLIPVRRDLSVQFSMAKTALLGKTLRARMKSAVETSGAKDSIDEVEKLLKTALDEPQKDLQSFLREQLQNPALALKFDDLRIDPLEGVQFEVRLSDDRIDDILIGNRGAGTQNNLIIALFRLVAKLQVGNYFIFAMEEPENSLHPKAQRQLLSVLQDISKKSQVICTTHSPVFIERSSFENNIILTRTLPGNTIAKTFNATMLSELRTNLGIRPSDALLKGGGNCAILVEGNTEEEAFPIFMEMLGLSEFQLGIAIVNLLGPNKHKVTNAARLLAAYDIPCVVVLDSNEHPDIERDAESLKQELPSIKKIFFLGRGAIEDYFPLKIVAQVINEHHSPNPPVSDSDFDDSKHGKARMSDFMRVMHERGLGSASGYLKRQIGSDGTKLMKQRGIEVDPELKEIFMEVKRIAGA